MKRMRVGHRAMVTRRSSLELIVEATVTSILSLEGIGGREAPGEGVLVVSRGKQKLDSITLRLAIFAGFAGADVNALTIVHLDLDRLITAVPAHVESHVMSSLL